MQETSIKLCALLLIACTAQPPSERPGEEVEEPYEKSLAETERLSQIRAQTTVTTPVSSCAALQGKLFEISRDGGGTYVLDKTLSSCPSREILYDDFKRPNKQHGQAVKAYAFNAALLIPEDVTLDLNGYELRLQPDGDAFGIRLANRSEIKGGTVTVEQGTLTGSENIWHSGISVGEPRTAGGSARAPSYFSFVSHWIIDDVTVDQQSGTTAVFVMGQGEYGIMRNVYIAASANTVVGIAFDWGTIGDLNAAEVELKETRRRFESSDTDEQVYTTHPHDIRLENITVGSLGPHIDIEDSAAIRISACHNIKIYDLTVDTVTTGVVLRAGELGYEFARSPHRELAHTGHELHGFVVNNAFRKGIVIDGYASNVHRAHLLQDPETQYDWLLNPTFPGIDAPYITDGSVHGQRPVAATQSWWEENSRGVLVTASANARVIGIAVSAFMTGVHIDRWVRDATLQDGTIEFNSGHGVAVLSLPSTEEPVADVRSGISILTNVIRGNGTDYADAAGIYYNNTTSSEFTNNTIGEDPETQMYCFKQSTNTTAVTLTGNACVRHPSGADHAID